jgi:uncharacterized protein with HEPN domain
MYRMRNQIIHGFIAVDMEIVWKTIQLELPDLPDQIGRLLKAFPEHRQVPGNSDL